MRGGPSCPRLPVRAGFPYTAMLDPPGKLSFDSVTYGPHPSRRNRGSLSKKTSLPTPSNKDSKRKAAWSVKTDCSSTVQADHCPPLSLTMPSAVLVKSEPGISRAVFVPVFYADYPHHESNARYFRQPTKTTSGPFAPWARSMPFSLVFPFGIPDHRLRCRVRRPDKRSAP